MEGNFHMNVLSGRTSSCFSFSCFQFRCNPLSRERAQHSRTLTCLCTCFYDFTVLFLLNPASSKQHDSNMCSQHSFFPTFYNLNCLFFSVSFSLCSVNLVGFRISVCTHNCDHYLVQYVKLSLLYLWQEEQS